MKHLFVMFHLQKENIQSAYEACDQYGGCTVETVEMMVNQINDAPMAVATSDSYDVYEGDTVCLDGTESSDSGMSSYSWTLNGEEFSSESSFCVDTRLIDSNDTENDLYVLTVADVYGITHSASVDILINNINVAPELSLGFDLEVQVPHDHDAATTQFSFNTVDVLESSDFDGDELSYSWYVDGSLVSSNMTPVLNLDSGLREICSVDDGFEGITEDNISIFVLPETNESPIADAGDVLIQEEVGNSNQIIFLNGSASTDADDQDYLTYSWSNVEQIAYGETVGSYNIQNLPSGIARITAPIE